MNLDKTYFFRHHNTHYDKYCQFSLTSILYGKPQALLISIARCCLWLVLFEGNIYVTRSWAFYISVFTPAGVFTNQFYITPLQCYLFSRGSLFLLQKLFILIHIFYGNTQFLYKFRDVAFLICSKGVSSVLHLFLT